MPIAKVQLPDGRIAKFEVPEGTNPQDVISFASERFAQDGLASEPIPSAQSLESQPQQQTSTVDQPQPPTMSNRMIDVGIREQMLSTMSPERGMLLEQEQSIEATPQERQQALENVKKQQSQEFQKLGSAATDMILESGGALGGASTGARLGSVFGAPGAVIGSAIGGIAGATLGKEASEAVGAREQTDGFGKSLGDATVEEAAGRLMASGLGAGGRIAQPLIRPIVEQAKNISNKLGLLVPVDELPNSFLSSQSIDPNNLTPRSIIEAQENILGRRELTRFEETGGRELQGKQAKLESIVMDSIQETTQRSTTLQTRDEINEKLMTALRPSGVGVEKAIAIGDNATSDAIRKSFINAKEGLKKPMSDAAEALRAVRHKATVPMEGIEQEVSQALANLPAELGEKQANAIKKQFDKLISKVDNGKATFADLEQFDKNILNAIPDFSPTKDVQNKIAGWYAGNIKPAIHARKVLAAEGDNVARQALEAQSKMRALKEIEGEMLSSKVGRALGFAETKQAIKGTKPSRVDAIIYESPESWAQTKNILSKSNPELIPILENRFKARLLRDSYDPRLREVTFDKMEKTLNKYGEDTITDIAGDTYARNFKDSLLITRGLRETQGLQALRAGISPDDQIFQNIRKAGTLQLGRSVAIFKIAATPLKRAIGLGRGSDEALFKAMQGERGELLMEKLNNRFMDSPDAYNTYSQLVREINRYDGEAELISETEFNNVVDNLGKIFNEESE